MACGVRRARGATVRCARSAHCACESVAASGSGPGFGMRGGRADTEPMHDAAATHATCDTPSVVIAAGAGAGRAPPPTMEAGEAREAQAAGRWRRWALGSLARWDMPGMPGGRHLGHGRLGVRVSGRYPAPGVRGQCAAPAVHRAS